MLSSKWWLRHAMPQHWIALFAVALILFDTLIKPLTIVALGLAVLAVLPWLLRLVKRLELPGGVKVEMLEELGKVTREAEQAGLLDEQPAPPNRPSYEVVFNDDPVLALAGLRIEIERCMNELREVTSSPTPRSLGLSPAVRELTGLGVLKQDEATAILKLLPILNAAVHSREPPMDAAEWAMKNGPLLLANLDAKIEQFRLRMPIPDTLQPPLPHGRQS